MAVACGEEYIVKKRERKIIILRLWKNIKLGNEEGDGNLGEEYQDFKNLGRGRISNCRELYTTLP